MSDILIYASVLPTSGVLIHRIIPLTEVRIENTEDTETYKNAFLIGSSKKSFMVYAETAEEKEEWLTSIRDTVSQHKRDTRSLQIEVEKIEAEAPIWQPDSATNSCSVCKCEFSLLNRRHHCRMCGKVVCGNCSPHRVVLPNIDTNKQRVCVQCFEIISEKNKQSEKTEKSDTEDPEKVEKETKDSKK